MNIPSAYAIRLAVREEFTRLNQIKIASAVRFSSDDVPEPYKSTHTVPEDIMIQAHAKEMLWVASDRKDFPVGYALLEENEGTIVLYQVDVLPEHGQRGLGKLLVERAISRARELGYSELYLTTFRHLPWNAPFYEKLGFTFPSPCEVPENIIATLNAELAATANRVVMRLVL